MSLNGAVSYRSTSPAITYRGGVEGFIRRCRLGGDGRSARLNRRLPRTSPRTLPNGGLRTAAKRTTHHTMDTAIQRDRAGQFLRQVATVRMGANGRLGLPSLLARCASAAGLEHLLEETDFGFAMSGASADSLSYLSSCSWERRHHQGAHCID